MNVEEKDVEGVSLHSGVLSGDEERELLAFLGDVTYRTIAMRGMVAKRTIACFGYDYQYRSRSVVEVKPIPALLIDVKRRCTDVAMVLDAFDQVIVSRYPEGAGIGWHTDSPVFGDLIMGLSLGAPARLHLRRRGETAAATMIELPARSLYMIGGPARWDFEHRVPPVRAERYSLTFRSVVGK
jgi:alkylated DNA repair dioxygenase AlkB